MSEEVQSKLLSINKDKITIKNTVLTNITKMLTERELLNKHDLQKNIKLITSKHSDNMEYNIVLKDNKKFFIKFIPQKITAINKTSGIHDFVETNKNNNNIVIVNDISSKAHHSLKQKYVLTEVFSEKELMMNIIEHRYQPIFEILNNLDIDQFLKERKCDKKSLPRIYINDPIVKYYNLKIGNIVRIIRPSGVSGKVVSYRLVVNGKMNK
jgi:DNA-directed RNA polymerase subunit H (RpoH/RPB5)